MRQEAGGKVPKRREEEDPVRPDQLLLLLTLTKLCPDWPAAHHPSSNLAADWPVRRWAEREAEHPHQQMSHWFTLKSHHVLSDSSLLKAHDALGEDAATGGAFERIAGT